RPPRPTLFPYTTLFRSGRTRAAAATYPDPEPPPLPPRHWTGRPPEAGRHDSGCPRRRCSAGSHSGHAVLPSGAPHIVGVDIVALGDVLTGNRNPQAVLDHISTRGNVTQGHLVSERHRLADLERDRGVGVQIPTGVLPR